MRSALLLAAGAALAAASQLGTSPNQPLLARSPLARVAPRQDEGCGYSQVLCGEGCIDLDEACCPDESYCLSGQYCTLGDNDVYGCCPIGELCSGSASQTTVYDDGTGNGGSGAEPTAFSEPEPTFSNFNNAPTTIAGFSPISASGAGFTGPVVTSTQAAASPLPTFGDGGEATGGSSAPLATVTTVVEKAGAAARVMPTAAAVAVLAFALL